MYIKRRLKFTYVSILLVSFILIIILSSIFMSFTGKSSDDKVLKKIGAKNLSYYTTLLKLNNELMQEVNRQILQNPDVILQEDFLNKLENEMASSHTGLALRVNNNVIYSSNYIKKDLEEIYLTPFKESTSMDVSYEPHNHLITLWQMDFYLNDGSEGSLFYLINIGKYENMVKHNAFIVIISILLILSIANGIITYFVSKSITRPLKELDTAANEIKQGNLDYKIKLNCKDEIGDLGSTFEEMRLRLKESLEMQHQYEENRKELISNISHDLKTPITSIKGYIEGIKDGVADTPDKMNKYVNTIHSKANYMNDLINDLFLYSTLDLNKIPFKFQSVDIISYINDCVEEINFDLDSSTIELNSKVPQNPIILSIDVQQLKRTIMNIVGNSIKYKTEEKLNIDIIVKENNEYVIVEIRDNGNGISAEALPFIFDRFYRADLSRETTFGGSGLGLAIAKKIIEEHGGDIWAESTKGLGTSIFFSLKKTSC